MSGRKARLVLITTLLFISAIANGQNIRGFYLTNISTWLGNATKENQILQYAQGNGFNYISLYDLTSLNWNSAATKNSLASFMSRARAQYGILQFGAVTEIYSFLANSIIPYNNSRANAAEKFDVLNLEFEFWAMSSISSSYCSKYLSPNGYSCDTTGAFKFGIKQFRLIDSLCAANGLISEIYLGWPNQGQMRQIAAIADRILLHAYRPTDSDIYSYSKGRLMDIASINSVTKVLPIFSSEPSFMGPWLNSHPVTEPYQKYLSDFTAETGSFKQNINLQGYQWFEYTFLPKTVTATASITAGGPLSFCSGDSVRLTANSGSSYLWNPGGQTTRSIVVTSPGSYTVRVTNSAGAMATSLPAVVTYSTSGTPPVITPNGPTSFCPGGSVILTSSHSANYLWSNGQTTQSVNVTSSGNYTVTTGNGTCTATSTVVNINAAAAPTPPVVTVYGSLNLCSGSQLVLTSSAAGNYVWSSGETTRSIIVTAAGNYSVNAVYGQNCSAQSAVQTVHVFTSPAAPVITPAGSLTLTTAQPAVTLTSSVSNSCLWSTNQVTNSISVSTQGTYWVTITDANGCTATSDPVSVSANGCIPPPVPVITLNHSSIITSGQTVTLTSSQAGGYLWSNGGTGNSIIVSNAGIYSVRTYSGGGCFSSSLPVNIIVVPADNGNLLSVSEVADFETTVFSVYPNPAVDKLNILISSVKEKNTSLQLIDLTGREILSRDVKLLPGENTFEENLSGLSPGIYFVSMISEEQRKTVKLLVR